MIKFIGFTVNHRFFENHSLPVPNTWTDLTNASYGCLLPNTPPIAICSPETDLFQHYIFQLITMAKGWDEGWIHLARIAANARIFENLDQAQSALEADEVGVLLTFDRQGFKIMESDSDCEYIVPSDGTEIQGEAIGIPVASSQKDLAEGFIDFVLSAYGQSLWLNLTSRKMPILSSAFNERLGEQAQVLYAVFNQTLRSSGVYFNDTLALDTMNSFKAYFNSVFIESHQELVDCWSLLAKAYHDGNITESEFETLATQMGTLVTIVDPITSEECKFTIDYARKTNGIVEEYRLLWTSAAKAQYQDVQNQIGLLLQNSFDRKNSYRYYDNISILPILGFRRRGSIL
jgi:ABC-type Fe3+ transport system substrate-binding protein